MQYVYIRINKSGSNSVLRWLDENEIPWNKFEIMKEQDYGKRGTSLPKSRLYKAIDDSNFKFFTIFRDPFKRAVSSYTYQFFKTTQIKEDLIKRVPLCTFKEFLTMPFEEMTDFQYYHSMPQYDFITDENDSIDYLDHLGQLENFSNTIKYFESNGFSIPKRYLEQENRSNWAPYKEYYDDDCIDLVKVRYKKDIELFNYSF